MAKRKWKDLPVAARWAIVIGAATEVALLVAAQIDITRRPAAQIRGGKMRWRLVSLVNVAGPLAYFCRGRIRVAPKR